MSMRPRSLFVTAIFVILGSPSRASSLDDPLQEDVMVYGVRRSTAAQSIITRDELLKGHYANAADALRRVPGLTMVNQGGDLGVQSALIRGASGPQTLVLIDGVPVMDANSPSRAFDFSNLAVVDIERIEVLRGPQSVLFGADAMGGVINIVTRRPSNRIETSLSGELGSYQSSRYSAALSGGVDGISGRLGGVRRKTEGFSSSADGEEKDGSSQDAVRARVIVAATEGFELDLSGSKTWSKADLDDFGGPGGDDPDHESATDFGTLRGQATYHIVPGWTQTVSVGWTSYLRDVSDPPQSEQDFSFKDTFVGRLRRVDTRGTWNIGNGHSAIVGLEELKESGSSKEAPEEHVGTSAILAEHHADWTSWFRSEIGVRHSQSSEGQSPTTYRAGYRFGNDGLALRLAWATGFKSPSIYQRYSDFGDRDLKPETVTALDVGIDGRMRAIGLSWSATAFQQRTSDLIEFDGRENRFANISRALSGGVESSFAVRPVGSTISIHGSATYQETRDLSTGEALPRRPMHQASCGVSFDPDVGATSLTLEGTHVGKRSDRTAVGIIASPDYQLVRIAAKVPIIASIVATGRIENVLDEKYEQVSGYQTPARSYFVGAESKF